MARPKRYETAADKQKAYRDRKKNLRRDAGLTVCTGPPDRENDRPTVPDAVGEIPTPAPSLTKIPFETKKVGEFRMLVLPERVEDEDTMPVVKPQIFRNDYGAVISERAWNQLQEKKRRAKEGGYVLDEYSQ